MRRPLLMHGADGSLLRRIGSEVAGRLGLEFVDAFATGIRKVSESGGGGRDADVTICSSAALLDRMQRVELLARATVVAVGPGLGEFDAALVGRLGGSVGVETLNGLLAREFAECHAVIGLGTEEEATVVDQIVEVARRASVVVAALQRTYSVEVGRSVLEAAVAELAFRSPVMLYLTDENVKRLHGERLSAAMLSSGLRMVEHVLVPGEERKCLGTLEEIFARALEGGIDRSSWVVAAGGGVTTDIGGLVAALWMRGLRWAAVPTTLLAMVDASVGGKTAVDFGVGKNAIGAFWQPSRVICDVEFLLTESERNYVGALSEVIKTALVGDRDLFGILESERNRVLERDLDLMAEVVRRCIQVKARVVGLDELEGGLRAVLNFGHTIGHALEALGEYRRYTHGEAVGLGMVAAVRLGVGLGYTAPTLATRIEDLLVAYGLPARLDGHELRAAAELLAHDKKRAGSSIRFVVAREVGDLAVVRLGLDELRDLVGNLA